MAEIQSQWQIDFEKSDALVVAQVEAFRHRVPILYVVLAINTVALAWTFRDIVPATIGIYLPILFVVLMMSRATFWYTRRTQRFSPDQARKMVRSSTIVACATSVVLLSWSIALYTYPGDQYLPGPRVKAHGHTIFFVGLTVISCVTLMMHVKAAAYSITLVVIPTFCLFLAWNGTHIEWAISVNLALVGAAMLYVVTVSARDFKKAVEAGEEASRLHNQQRALANTDALTNLDNRRRFYEKLTDIVRTTEPFAVVMVDLDGFKQVNDVHGHVIGDFVLSEIAGRIATAAAGSESIARIGGDEFAVLLTGSPMTEDVMALGESIVEVAKTPVRRDGISINIGASVGINQVSAGELDTPHARHIERADHALFHVKERGGNGVELFTMDHELIIKRKGVVEQTLRGADLMDELTLVYQPIYIAKTQVLQGFEALIRWNSPVLGIVMPGEFIPIAERSDIISQITRIVLKSSLEEALRWPASIRLKVNLSARDLASPEQMVSLVSILRRSGVAAERVTFEVTETAFSENRAAVQSAVTLLKAIGSSIAIDDFGTGYSSLSTIHCLSPNLIKIDQSFISRLGESIGAEAMIKTIIEMCRNMRARSLAEGVEHRHQVEILTRLGCDELQGYYFSKSVDAATAFDLARHEQNSIG